MIGFFKGLQKERKEFDRAQVLSYVKRRLLEDNKYSLFNENTVKKRYRGFIAKLYHSAKGFCK